MGSVRSEPWKRSPKSPARSAKAQSSSELPQRAQDRSRGAPHTPSGAGSVRSEPWKRLPIIPSTQRESPILLRASSARAGPIPRSAPYAQRSGIGPQRALEAITKIPSAQRESLSSPELPQRAQDRSRGALQAPSPNASLSQASIKFVIDCPLLCKYEGPTPFRLLFDQVAVAVTVRKASR